MKFPGPTRHNQRSPPTAHCPLSPAADIPLHWLCAAMCQSTKSLRDSGGMWLVRSVFRTVEIVGNRCCLEDRGLSTLSEHAARRPMGQMMIRSVTTVEDSARPTSGSDMIPSYRTTIILTRRSKGFRLGKRRLPKCCGITTLYAVGQSSS